MLHLPIGMSSAKFSPFRSFLRKHGKTAMLMGVGDIIAQKHLEDDVVKIGRTIKFMGVGLFFMGPCLSKWFEVLDVLVPHEKSHIKRGVRKMIIDQFLFCPVFSFLLMGVFGMVNNDSRERLLSRYTDDYPTVLKMNYRFWPILQVLNFALIPVPFQVTFCQCAAVFWNILLAKVVS